MRESKILPDANRSANRRRKLERAGRHVPAVVVAAVITGTAVVSASIPPGEITSTTPVYDLAGNVQTVNERWSYSFSWGAIPVGHVTISGSELEIDGERRLGVHATGKTNSFIDLLWKYRLNAVGSIRLEPFGPGAFYSAEQERAKQKFTTIEFAPDQTIRSSRRKGDRLQEYEFKASNTFDFLSTTWLLLNLEYEIGQVYKVDTLTGTSRYLVNLEVADLDTIEAGGKQVQAYRLVATTSELTDPDETEHKHRGTSIWVTAERPRRLLKAEAKTFWGAIHLQLTKIENINDRGLGINVAAMPSLDGVDKIGDVSVDEAEERRPSTRPRYVGHR